jgi:hypothetical protein
MSILLRCLPILILGIVVGYAGGLWEVAGTELPSLRDGQARPTVAPATGELHSKAVVENGETFDFGVMEQNTKKSHAFIFRNDGNLPLTLDKISTTCKCTLGNVGKGVVQPGATTEVTLEWEAKTGDTEFTQSAKIKTNDPQRPEIQLVVTGKVRQAIFT